MFCPADVCSVSVHTIASSERVAVMVVAAPGPEVAAAVVVEALAATVLEYTVIRGGIVHIPVADCLPNRDDRPT